MKNPYNKDAVSDKNGEVRIIRPAKEALKNERKA